MCIPVSNFFCLLIWCSGEFHLKSHSPSPRPIDILLDYFIKQNPCRSEYVQILFNAILFAVDVHVIACQATAKGFYQLNMFYIFVHSNFQHSQESKSVSDSALFDTTLGSHKPREWRRLYLLFAV